MFSPLDRIWVNNYDLDTPKTINIPEDETLNSVFEKSCRLFGPKPAFYNLGASITFDKLDKEVTALASYLQNDLGLKKGDRIAIQIPNLIQTPIAIFAALKAGLIIVNTNPLYTAKEMLFQFEDSDVKAIIILENFLSKLEDILGRSPIKYVIATRVGDYLPFPKNELINFVIRHIKKAIPSHNLSPIWWKDVIKKGSEKPCTEVEIKNSDIAFLQYTGGTTGLPKGAILTHKNIVANFTQIQAWIKSADINQHDFVCSPLPFYHIFSLTCNLLTFIKLGCSNLLITNPKEFNSFVKEIRRYPVSVITGVNTLFNALLQHKKFNRIDWQKYKVIVAGGCALQKSVAEEFKVRTGKSIIEGYGLTEASPLVSCGPFVKQGKIGTVGLPFPNTDICFIDDDGKELKSGEIGELAVKGPQIMSGYWLKPEETKKVLKDGWLLTGDIGYIDKDGYIKLVDRKKEMILVSGFNVYPNEVEDALASHVAVLESAVVGVDDVQSGERPVAVIVKKQNQKVSGKDLRAHCKKYLTSYKVPKDYIFIDELPKSNVGKILRRVVKDKILKGNYPRG